MTETKAACRPMSPLACGKVTWESELPKGGECSKILALECTYQVEHLCIEMRGRVGREAPTLQESALYSWMRMNAMRIQELNSMLMSYLNKDGITLREMHQVVYGLSPADGAQP